MDTSRLSACTFALRERPWQEALEVVARAGYRKVDLLGRAPHLSLNPAEFDPRAAKDAAAGLGLTIANLGTYVGRAFSADDAAARERELENAHRAIDLAAFLGARSIRVVPGDDTPAAMDAIAPWFARAAAYAAESGVYMGFETHGGGISGVPERAADLCEKVGSPYFGVLYDPCNLMQGGADYRLALWTMRDHIVHVHLKDGAVDVRTGFQKVMLGEGHIDYAWVLAALDAIGYAGDLALEYELAEPTPEVGMARWLETARSM